MKEYYEAINKHYEFMQKDSSSLEAEASRRRSWGS